MTLYAKMADDLKSGNYKNKTDTVIKKKFDVYADIRYFKAILIERGEQKDFEEEYDLNRITYTMIKSCDDNVEGLQFVRYLEEIGMPLNCNHVTFINSETRTEAISRISRHYPIWAIILQIKNGDNKVNKRIWSREAVYNMTNEEIENYSQLCISAIKNNFTYIEAGNSWKESNFKLGIAYVMPEILSRLCVRMSKDTQLKTLELLDMIYRSEKIENFKNIKNLSKRLILSMNEKTKIENFNSLIKLYPYVPKSDYERRDYVDIFDYLNFPDRNLDQYKKITIEESVAEVLLQLLEHKDKHDMAIIRLFYMYNLDFLSAENIEIFKKYIWKHTDENKLPQIPNSYLKNLILHLPTPKNINSKLRLKKYILNLDFQKEKKGTIQYSKYDKPIILSELIACTYSDDNKEGILWDKQSIQAIIQKICEAWNNDQSILISYDKSSSFYRDMECQIYN